MTDRHWFDTLSVSLAPIADRRGFVHAAGALIAGLALRGAGSSTDAKRKNRANDKKITADKNGGKGGGGGKSDKRKRKDKKKKDKEKRRRDPSCEVVCVQEYGELFPEEIPVCIAICNKCRIRANFCVIGSDPHKKATCCFEGDQCCQDSHACCPSDSVCCPGYPQSSPGPCCAAEEECCPSDFYGCCGELETCCPGEGCVYLNRNQRNCGSCDNRCAPDELCTNGSCLPAPPGGCPGRTLCDGYCVDTQRDTSHCGECRKLCRNGQDCVDGKCEPEGWECCETENGAVCTYTTGPLAENRLHCGGCGSDCPGDSIGGQWCFEGACGCGSTRRWCGEPLSCVPNSLPC